MVLIDRLVDWAPGRAECEFLVRAGSAFVDRDGLRTPFTMEHMAQSVAICLGYDAYRGGLGTRVGMIVSCRTFEAHKPLCAVGELLTVSVEQLSGNESTSQFGCHIVSETGPVSEATLTLFYGELPKD